MWFFFSMEEDFVLFCCSELVGDCSFSCLLYPLEMRLWQYLEAEIRIRTRFARTGVDNVYSSAHKATQTHRLFR